MSRTEHTPRWQQHSQLVIVTTLLITGLILRVYGIGNQPLWYDELYSATQASVPVLDVPASIRAFDMHPPTYYLQLSVWEKLGSSDVWLRLNSTFWWLLGAVSLHYIVSRIVSPPAAMLTTLLYAVNPTGIHFGQELRMYSLLTFLAIWSFYFVERLLGSECKADIKRFSALLFLTTVTVIYSHGAGFLILLCMWAQAALMTLGRQTSLRNGFRFMVVQGFAVLAGVPEHLRAAAMQSNFGGLSYAIAPSARELLRQSSWLFAGAGELLQGWTPLITVALIGVPMCFACWTKGPARRAILCYILVPIAACFTISHLSGPIWVFRAISFAVPFCCLGLAFGLTQLAAALTDRYAGTMSLKRVAYVGYVTLLLCFFALAIHSQRSVRPRPSHFKQVVEFVRSHSAPQDVVFVPQEFCYWAFCWYYVEPGAVDPLTDPGRQSTETGQIIAKMAPIDAAATELLSTTESHNVWMLVRGHVHAREILKDVGSGQGFEPELISQHGKIRLWRLRSPLREPLLANQP